MKLSTQWYLHLNSKEKEDIIKIYNSMGTDRLLLQLEKIIAKKIEDIRKTNNQDYDSPSWSHYQAHKNGQVQSLQEILNLLPTNKDNQP